MCDLVPVISKVDNVVQRQGPKYCLTYTYANNTHKVFGVIHIYHVLVLDIFIYDNSCSDPSLNVFFLWGPKYCNKGKWVVSQKLFTPLCIIFLFSWTLYSYYLHFHLIPPFPYFSLSVTTFLCESLDKCF